MGAFKESHGGRLRNAKLRNAYLEGSARDEALRRFRDAKSWDLSARQLCDVELLLNGAVSPLEGFMSPAEYEAVLRGMRLPSGVLWPVPVTLDVSEDFAAGLEPGETIALRDGEGILASLVEVGETWRPEKDEEARAVYGTADDAHPGVSRLLRRTHPVYVSGRVFGLEPILHYDHRALRNSPAELRECFRKLGWRRVVAFQTRQPLHRAQVALTTQAARACEANLLLHPVVGGTELRRRLALGLDIPDWFTYPEVAAELRRAYPPRDRQGFVVLFTGLSGAGKSTLAHALVAMLRENGERQVTLLDGDIVRKNLSSELGFSHEHREINLRRIGFVAAEIARNGGVAICAPIAPYATTRRELRETIEAVGGFVEVCVSTPLETCEARDRKGLYARARAGLIEGFTGIDDPYEPPEEPDMEIDTAVIRPDLAAHRVFVKLESLGFLG